MAHDYARLGRFVLQRRRELRLAQEELRERGGPSSTTVSKIELGAVRSLRARTREDLDRALNWALGSTTSILEGGEPTPILQPDEIAPGPPDGSVLHDDEAPIKEFSDEHLLAIVSERIGDYRQKIAALEAELDVYRRLTREETIAALAGKTWDEVDPDLRRRDLDPSVTWDDLRRAEGTQGESVEEE